MKRYVFLAVAVAVLLIFLLQGRNHQASAPGEPNTASEAPAVADLTNQQDVTNQGGQIGAEQARSVPATNPMGYDDPETIRAFNESPDVPISFYGLVVDQDSNALQNVKVGLRIWQWQPATPLGENTKMTQVESETGPDGRFNLSGMSGHSVTVLGFTKDGYGPEFVRSDHGRYGPSGGSPEQPEVFRMWSTNIHEPLIIGDRMFKIVPDGRRYGIDLAKGVIAEGEDGDLVVWIKRPQSVESSQRFAWSCGMAIPGGGFEPEKDRGSPMFRAPVSDYTNVFMFDVEYNTPARDGMSLDNRFYFRLRNGLFGRLSADFWTMYHNWPSYSKDPAFGQIHLAYAINPSGSRILREQVLVPPSQGLDAGASKFPAQLTWPPR